MGSRGNLPSASRAYRSASSNRALLLKSEMTKRYQCSLTASACPVSPRLADSVSSSSAA